MTPFQSVSGGGTHEREKPAVVTPLTATSTGALAGAVEKIKKGQDYIILVNVSLPSSGISTVMGGVNGPIATVSVAMERLYE